MVVLTDDLRRRMAKEQRGLCFYCAMRLHDDMTWEHLVARAHRGKDKLSNVVVSHSICNSLVGVLPVAAKWALHDIGHSLGSDAFFIVAARLKPYANIAGTSPMSVQRRPKRPPEHRHRQTVERFVEFLPLELRVAA